MTKPKRVKIPCVICGRQAKKGYEYAHLCAKHFPKGSGMRKNPRGDSSLRHYVIMQLGGDGVANSEATNEAEQSLRDVARHGAGAGFPGFTYTRDCVKFFDANEDAIMALADDMADSTLGRKGNVWLMIGGFSMVPSASIDDLKNSLAWLALESVANGDE